MTPRIFTSIDLEMNKAGNNTTDIIQIGAVIGDVFTGAILERLSLFIKIDKPLDPFIIELTGITDHILETQGMSLHEAYAILKEAHERHGAHKMVIQWGGGDTWELKKQLCGKKNIIKDPTTSLLRKIRLLLKLDPIDWCFGYTFWNVKNICQALQLSKGFGFQGGLKKNCARFGVPFEGPAHDALQDSLNTFKLMVKLFPKLRSA